MALPTPDDPQALVVAVADRLRKEGPEEPIAKSGQRTWRGPGRGGRLQVTDGASERRGDAVDLVPGNGENERLRVGLTGGRAGHPHGVARGSSSELDHEVF